MGGRRGRLISASDRKRAIKLVKEATQAGARQKSACRELGISDRTLQRWKNESTPVEDQRHIAKRPVPKNKLSKKEVKPNPRYRKSTGVSKPASKPDCTQACGREYVYRFRINVLSGLETP